jgi:hypothetical protein
VVAVKSNGKVVKPEGTPYVVVKLVGTLPLVVVKLGGTP